MAEETQIYLFEFHGRAEVVRSTQGQLSLPNESEIVSDLNDNSALIAQTIQGELVRGLSPSLSVQVQIHFYAGSITLAGVIILLDAMGTLPGSAEFVATFSRLIEIVIQRVVQRWILDKLDTENFTVTIQVEVNQSMQRQRSGWMNFQNLERLMIINLVLLLILMILLIPSLLPSPTPTGTSTFTPTNTLTYTPTSTSTSTLTPTNTLTSTPPPSFTPTNTPTNTSTPTITPFQ